MQLRRLQLRDYRNFAQAQIPFGPRFTVLAGHNGAGKTNVLEALYLVSTLRSFRTSDTRSLVRKGCPGTQVELTAHDPELGLERTLTVRLEDTGRAFRRTAQLDGKTVRAAKDFYGRIPAILFTPEDLGVLRGSPSGRRQFLDRVLFARTRSHIEDVQTYEKLLRSRNRVLKSEPGELPHAERERLLDTYDAGLAEIGGRIWARRAAVVAELRADFEAGFAHIHGPELEAALRYAPRADPQADPGSTEALDAEQFRQVLEAALTERRSRDLQRRSTGVGPHLDDLVFELDGHEAATFASQGQSRAMVLAFKIAELKAARAATRRAPMLLLDDVSSELDPQRSAQLFATLTEEVGQCVLTTTAAAYIELPSHVDRLDLSVERGRIGPGSPA